MQSSINVIRPLKLSGSARSNSTLESFWTGGGGGTSTEENIAWKVSQQVSILFWKKIS